MRKSLAAAAFLLASGPAAADPQGYLDVFYVPSAKVEERNPGFGLRTDDGEGFGVKGWSPMSRNMVFTGEYQSVSYDRGTPDNTQYRIGAGFIGDRGGGMLVEYISAQDYIEADGIGVHLRMGGPNLYAQVGYVSLNDNFEESHGLELASGLSFTNHRGTGIFVDIRHTQLKGQETKVEIETTDVRAGVRIGFGGRRR